MTILNLKSVTSAVCALAVTAFLSWSFADSFNQVYGTRGADAGLFAAVSALVR
jgi:hypothetical protein